MSGYAFFSLFMEYEFETTMTFEDGVHSLEVKAVDTANNAISFKRTIIVDAPGPTVEIDGLPSSKYIKHNKKDPVINITVTDNFDQLRFYQDGSELFYQEFQEPYAMRGIEKEFNNIKLSLKEGLNVFTFEAEDLAGNKTTKTVELYKLKKGEQPPQNHETPDGPAKPGKGNGKKDK